MKVKDLLEVFKTVDENTQIVVSVDDNGVTDIDSFITFYNNDEGFFWTPDTEEEEAEALEEGYEKVVVIEARV